jgi:uncharacterized membrane protein YcaP (DUF421 family)
MGWASRANGNAHTRCNGHTGCCCSIKQVTAILDFMFTPSLPWWEFILRACIVYGALLVMVRLSGKRTIGQFTPFDLLVVLLLSEGVSNSLSGSDESLTGGLIVAVSLILLNALVGLLASRSHPVEKLVEGEPVLLGRDGRLFGRAMARNRLSAATLDESLRRADCPLSDMKLAVLEANGEISIMKHYRTAQVAPEPEAPQ